MRLITIQISVAALMFSALITGCAGYGNSAHPEQGEALSEMVGRQTAYPNKTVEPGNPTLDGTIAARVIKTYRADAANRDAVRNTIQVNIGGKK